MNESMELAAFVGLVTLENKKAARLERTSSFLDLMS
jgi:hypothetical protein